MNEGYLAPGAEIKKINKSKTDNPVDLSSKNIELLNTHYSVDLNLYEQMDGRSCAELTEKIYSIWISTI